MHNLMPEWEKIWEIILVQNPSLADMMCVVLPATWNTDEYLMHILYFLFLRFIRFFIFWKN